MIAPLIGLTGRRITASRVTGIDPILDELDLDLYYTGYARGVLEAGGQPVFLAMEADAATVVPRLDGVVLTGGADIDPAAYGHDPVPEIIGPEPDRDAYEFAVLEAAQAAQLPVLGICRGIQIMNVSAGGTLHQHVPEQARTDVSVDTEVHEVNLVDGSTLHDMYGDVRKVNSLHHQVLDDVGARYRVVGRTPAGGIEAIESEAGDEIGVQWHPEMMSSRADDALFGWLVDKARASASR